MSAHVLTEAEARSLTERIKTQVNRNAKLMRQAWDGKIWVPLGYPSFSEWLTATVGVTRQRAYQLIAIDTMTEVVADALQLPATFTLTDSQTRSIIRHGSDAFIRKVKESLGEDTAPEERAKAVCDELRRLARADRSISAASRSASPRTTSTDVPRTGANYTQPAERNAANLTLIAEALHAHARSIGQMSHTDESRAQLSSALNVFRARMQQLSTEGVR